MDEGANRNKPGDLVEHNKVGWRNKDGRKVGEKAS